MRLTKTFILLAALLTLGAGFAGCGNWKIAIPGTEPAPRAARAAEIRVSRCQLSARALHADASLDTFEQIENWTREMLPHRREDEFRRAFAEAVGEAVYEVMRGLRTGTHTSQELSQRAVMLARGLEGSFKDNLRELMERNQVDPEDPCLPVGIGTAERRFVRGLDPFAQLSWSRSRNHLLASYLLAPIRLGSQRRLSELTAEETGRRLLLLRWEDDEIEALRSTLARAEGRNWILDLRSAAGLGTVFAQELKEWTEARIAADERIVIWVDRYTRGLPEVFAAKFASEFENVLLVGERTPGYVRAPCLREGRASSDPEASWVTLRLACELLPEATERLERYGAVPEVWATVDTPALSVLRQFTLRSLGVFGQSPPRNLVEIRALGQANRTSPENRFPGRAERVVRVRQVREWLRGQGTQADEATKLGSVLRIWSQ